MKNVWIVLATAALCVAASPKRVASPLEQRITKLAAAFPGEMGVAVLDLSSGSEFSVNGDRRFPTERFTKACLKN